MPVQKGSGTQLEKIMPVQKGNRIKVKKVMPIEVENGTELEKPQEKEYGKPTYNPKCSVYHMEWYKCPAHTYAQYRYLYMVL